MTESPSGFEMSESTAKLQLADDEATFVNERGAGGVLTIDLAAIAANWLDCDRRAGDAECAAVIKADAYGLGIEPVAAALAKAGCQTFFVALLDEALRICTVAPGTAIYVLNGFNPGTASAFQDIDARPVLGSLEEIEEWDRYARAVNEPLAAAIHVDTGMSRHGLTIAEAEEIAKKQNDFAFALTIVMSHLARADEVSHEMTVAQVEKFKGVAALFPGIPASLANSAGLLAHPDSRFDLVRPGIALYGGEALIDGQNPMKPVARLDVHVLQVRHGKQGDTVGYGGEYTLRRDSRLAVLAAGYADGIPRASGSTDAKRGMEAVVAGRRCPIVGRVSMDLVVADVTEVPEGDVKRGDMARLLGEGITVDDLARASGTVGYEILTRLGRRYRRVYEGE
jgi:alanine racemase